MLKKIGLLFMLIFLVSNVLAITGTDSGNTTLLVSDIGHLGANISSATNPAIPFERRMTSNRLQGDHMIAGVYENDTTSLKASGRFGILNIDVFNPLIDTVRAEDITLHEANIKWNTDEDSYSIVKYGTTSTLLNLEARKSVFEKGHVVPLTGLDIETTYFFNVSSCDRFGYCSYVGVFSFKTSSSPVVPGGEAGGFGGGGVSRTAQGYSITKYFASIPANKTIQIPIVSEFIAFNKMLFKLNNQKDKVEIKITRFNPKIEDAPALKNEVYQYLKVDHDKIKDEDVDYTQILFSVTKDWLDTHKLKAENIVLLRLVDKEWKEVSTKIVSQPGVSVSYESSFQGMSYYAIVGKETKGEKIEVKEKEAEEKEEVTPEEKKEGETGKDKKGVKKEAEKEEAPEVEKETNVWVGVLIFVVLVTIGYLVYRRMER